MTDFLIHKEDLHTTQMVERAPGPPAEGAARLKLDVFAMTANNVTYAAMGTGPLGYWDFFPAPDGWGRVPVWGFADVVESRAEGVAVGTRLYGYFPISTVLDVWPVRLRETGFTDSAPPRQGKAPIYNQYLITSADPAYDRDHEAEQVLFRPLYATGWWAADCITRSPMPVRAAILSSASSKTALATAARLRDLGGIEIVALTSPGNADYVRSLGLYDRIASYEAVATLADAGPAVFVDYQGRLETVRAVHEGLGDGLVRSLIIGATDWASAVATDPAVTIPGPQREFFFVPDYAARRLAEDAALSDAMTADLRAFYARSRAFTSAIPVKGADAITAAWERLVSGTVAPRDSLVARW